MGESQPPAKIETTPIVINVSIWTLFSDGHSGGGTKIGEFEKIFIELPEDAARTYFESRFKRSPDHVTCECCGEDFYVVSGTLAEFQKAGYMRYANVPGKVLYISYEEVLKTSIQRITYEHTTDKKD